MCVFSEGNSDYGNISAPVSRYSLTVTHDLSWVLPIFCPKGAAKKISMQTYVLTI